MHSQLEHTRRRVWTRVAGLWVIKVACDERSTGQETDCAEKLTCISRAHPCCLLHVLCVLGWVVCLSSHHTHQTHWICGDICVYIYIYMSMINKTLYRAWDVSGHNYFVVYVFWIYYYL